MKLLLDSNSVIAAAKGWLYVFNRKGLTKIQAEHIDEVHEKVKCYLEGGYEEHELISAVAADKQPVLKKYLDAIAQAGALHGRTTVNQNSNLAIEESILQEDGRRLAFAFNGKRILVSLDGKPQNCQNQEYDAHLMFLTPQQMDTEWSLFWQGRNRGPHLLFVLDEHAQRLDDSIIHKRKRFARWLISSSNIDFWDTRTVRLYSLDSKAMTLKLLFEVKLSKIFEGNRSRPQIVNPTADGQLPLVIAKAEVPFYSYSVSGCGLNYSLLAEELERKFIARVALPDQREPSTKRFLVESRDWRSSNDTVRRARVNPQDANGWPVAGSILDLRVRALERFFSELPECAPIVKNREIDLLQSRGAHPHTDYLIEVLKTRLHTLPASLKATASGLHICQSGEHFAYSFIETKAIRDLLLCIAKAIFYADSLANVETQHECDFTSFMDAEKLQHLVLRQNDVLDKFRVNRCFTFMHVQRYGFSAWIGRFAHGN